MLTEHSGGLHALVVGARGYGRVGSVLLGSVGWRLIGSAGCPVIVVPEVAA